MKVLRALKRVFRSRINWIVAIFIAILAFVLSVWFANFRFVWDLMLNSPVGFADKIEILISLVSSINTSFASLSSVVIAVLLGINMAMVFYIYKNRVKTTRKGLFASIGGFVSGVFGMGCASCGTFLLGPLLSLVGASWVVSLLPYNGVEFGALSIAIFIFAIFIFAKRIEDPKVCRIT